MFSKNQVDVGWFSLKSMKTIFSKLLGPLASSAEVMTFRVMIHDSLTKYCNGQKNFFSHNIGFLGIKRRRILCLIQKDILFVVTSAPITSYFKIPLTGVVTEKNVWRPKFTCLFSKKFCKVHFVTKVSLYFWNLRKILRLVMPMIPTEYCILKNHYCTCYRKPNLL
jgi:hypothetical protein